MDTSYDVYGNLEPTMIYLGRPGQRLVGAIPGIQEDTCHYERNLNNTSLIEFTVSRDINGEINPMYDLIQQHFELCMPGKGWFKINEEPVIESDGNIETKSVRAESLEIELQQFDLVNFEINTASVSSKEMLATDNKYPANGYYAFQDQVLFYRDTTDLDALSDEFYGSTVSDLEGDPIYEHPQILQSWRIDFDYSRLDEDLQDAADAYREAGWPSTANRLEGYIGTIKANTPERKNTVLVLCTNYPELRRYIHLTVNTQIVKNDETSGVYSIKQVVDNEAKRMRELSLLNIILDDHGWKVGYVDDWIDADSPIEADHIKLANMVGRFEVDSQDIYSFLTQEVATYFECMFVFDTENYTVNVYKIHNLGNDTNVYLSFHNIQNSITRNSEKQLYTLYHVSGGENLDVIEANFGENWIENIDYFLNTDNFSQEFIDKYVYWRDYRESRRQDYMDASILRRNAQQVADEIYDRVPVDMVDTAQYSTLSDDELVNERASQESIMVGIETTYVDEEGEFIGEEALAEISTEDYQYYILLKEQIIPNLDIALYNRGVSSATDTRPYFDGYMYDFDRYGDSYGVGELKSMITTLTNSVTTLEKRGFNVPGEQGDAYAQKQYELYLKYNEALEECRDVYDVRLQEYNDAMDVVNDYQNQMNAIKDDVNITNSRFGFIDDDLWLLDRYRIHTDYVNENIITTSISTGEEWVNKAYELYLDAKKQLEADSQPQWTFSTTQDNLLLMPEFKAWHGQLEVGNFIRVAMREDFQVKLRVTSIGFNPFLIEPTIDLTFSNMTQYASERNDFVSLMNSENRSSKNQVYATLTRTVDGSDINVDTAFVLRLLNNSTFSSYMGSYSTDIGGGIVGDVTTATISAVQGNISHIVSEQIDAAEINVTHIVGETAEFNELFTQYIDSEYIVTEVLRADQAEISELSAEIIRVGTDSITEITGDYISTATINATQIVGETGDFETLTSNIINSNAINALEIDVHNITGDMAYFGEIISPYIEAGEITVETLEAALANVDVLNADAILANTTFTRSLQSLMSTSVSSIVDDAYIQSAVINKLGVADLAAGNIVLTENMKILSENGAMIMDGTALQIIGKDENDNEYVGIQLGYDTNQQPSLILRNSDGATVLTPQGITENAVPDQLIRNDMIRTGTISEDRLGFSVMKTGDRVQLTQIYNGEEAWGVQYTTFVNNTTNELGRISTGLEESATYTIRIETPDGIDISGGNIRLIAHLLRNGIEVTEDYSGEYFVWSRSSSDSAGDTAWNNAHSTGTKILTISGSDIVRNANFVCHFQWDNGISTS